MNKKQIVTLVMVVVAVIVLSVIIDRVKVVPISMNEQKQELSRIVSLRVNEYQQDIQNASSNLEECFQIVSSSSETLCNVSLSNKQHFLRFLGILDLHKYEIVDIYISADDRYVLQFKSIEETKK